MIRKIYITIIMLLMFISASFAQATTASIGTVTASPGESITVPINVTNFTGIGSITFKIRYNPNLMNFTGTSDEATTGFAEGTTDSTINIAFFVNPSHTFTDGLLLNLNFEYLGMTSSSLSFLSSCEVTQGTTIIYPSYTDGMVNIDTTNTCKATILNTTASTGGDITIPIKYENFGSDVGAITQKIQYDASALSFINITSSGNLAGAIASASNGIVTITWSNISGADINWASNLINLNFQYTGNTATDVEFYSGSLIATNAAANIAVSYFNGTVTPGATTATASLGSVSGVTQGQDIEIPLTFSGLTSGTPNGVGAVTLELTYDNSVLSYTGVDSNIYSATVNGTSSTINISWSDVNAADINGLFLKLKFRYNGIGSANVNFGSGCSFTTLLSDVVQVAYTNASVTPSVSAADATIGSVPGNIGDNVLVPVNFSGLPTNMGAATLHLNFDNSKLTYVGVQDNTFSATVGATTNTVTITWASTATDINGTFLNLIFENRSSNSDCLAAVDFASGCELTDATATIISANWKNGGIIETIPPTAIAQNIYALLDTAGNVTILAADVNNGSTDNCGIDTMTVAPNTFTCSNVGANTVILTVTDINGYTDTASAIVTVYDSIAPTAIAQNIYALLDTAGNVTILATDVNNGSTDNCGIDTMFVTPNTFTCSNIGANPVILTVTDVNGNTDTASAIIAVYDSIAPVAIAKEFTALLDTAGNVTILADSINNGSTDNCSIDTMFVTPNTFTTANVGANTVILTVVDVNGNTDTASAIVTINCVVVNAKVILQGAYSTGSGLMSTTLRTKAYFPTKQPYSGTPWNYAGTDSVLSIPTNVVDWILVDLRTGTTASTTVDSKVGFLLADGSIVGLDGVSSLTFPGRALGDYYIVVRHRNHLAVMSATIQSLSSTSTLYDFTSAVSQSYGSPNPAVLASDGKAMMIMGDVNSNGTARAGGPPFVNDLLLLNAYTGILVKQEYSSYDVDLDGIARSGGPPFVNDAIKLSSNIGITVYQTRVPN